MKTRYVWHFHHDRLWEPLLCGPLEYRRDGIRQTKASDERRLRLELLRLVKSPKITGMSKAAVLKLHRNECPDCPWSESWQTIFTHRVRNKDRSHGCWCRPSEGRKVL